VLCRDWLLLTWLAIAASLPGCAIYDPWQVWRYHLDYNTERACAAHITFYDHLPPAPVRTRLMQWGYNVGPAVPSGAFIIPANTPVCPVPTTPAVPPAPAAEAPAGSPPDLLDRSSPPELPQMSPTAREPSEIQPLNRAVAAPSVAQRTAWLFQK